MTYILDILKGVRRALKDGCFALAHSRRFQSSCVLSGDIFAAYAAREFLAVDSACFLQVGAHNGAGAHDIGSIIRKLGVRSILLEPQPDAYAALRASYRGIRNVECVNAALAHEGGEISLYRIRSSMDQYHAGRASGKAFATSIASMDRLHPVRFFRQNCSERGALLSDDEIVEEVSVQAMTLPRLLQTHDVDDVTVLSIDTEGFDMDIIRMIEKSALRPRVIRYEHKHLGGKRQCRASWSLVMRMGYDVILDRRTGDTICVLQ